MGMLWLKSCPRCRGDLYQERTELDEEELYCMQCGYRRFGMLAVSEKRLDTEREPVMPRAA